MVRVPCKLAALLDQGSKTACHCVWWRETGLPPSMTFEYIEHHDSEQFSVYEYEAVRYVAAPGGSLVGFVVRVEVGS